MLTKSAFICSKNSIVLLHVIKAQARKAQGPIVFLRNFCFFCIDYPGIFGGLNMVKNS